MNARIAVLIGLLAAAARLVGEAAPGPVAAADSAGNMVRLPVPAARVAALDAGAAETLVALGAGRTIVARRMDDGGADGVSGVEAGDATAGSAALSRILRLRPDLVVIGADGEKAFGTELRDRKIPLFLWAPADSTTLARSIMSLGTLVGEGKAATKLAATLTLAVKRIRIVTDALPGTRRPLVYWLAPNQRSSAFGRNSLASFVIEASGGRNATTAGGHVSPVTAEAAQVALSDPRSIIVTGSPDEAAPAWWAEVGAPWSTQAPGRRLSMPSADAAIAGPRLPEIILTLARRLHPELFP